MNSVRFRAIAVALCMAGSSVSAYYARPTIHLADQQTKVDLEHIFPAKFAEWEIDRNIPLSVISPDVQAQLDKIYNQVLSRTYINRQGQRIMLSVAYGGDQSDGTRAHRPDVCYPAQGFQTLSSGTSTVKLNDHVLPIRTMVAALGARVEPISYWVMVGDKVALNGTEQKLAQMRYGLRGMIADGMLIRVSSIDKDHGAAFALQASFIAQMKVAFESEWQPRVFGAAS